MVVTSLAENDTRGALLLLVLVQLRWASCFHTCALLRHGRIRWLKTFTYLVCTVNRTPLGHVRWVTWMPGLQVVVQGALFYDPW
jgi:hypothetical protein